MSKTLLLIDGNALIYRAYHALPPFKTTDGTPTGAIYGFFSILQKAILDFRPTHLIVCFDTPKPTFRKEMFAEYRAQRPKAPDDLIVQIPHIHSLLKAAGITYLEKEGYEADDLLGTISRHLHAKDMRVLVFTGDRDMLQLIDDHTFVVMPQKGITTVAVYGKQEVVDKYGVTPEQIPDYKALAGDAGDNYFGAKGIGPKTATKLLNQFGHLENLMANLQDVQDERIRKILADHKDDILMSKRLAHLVNDVDVEFEMKNAEFTHFDEGLKTELDKLQLWNLKSRLFKNTAKPVIKKVEKEEEVKNSDQMDLFS